MANEELLPSEVRARILRDHERLRTEIDTLRRRARSVRRGDDEGSFREQAERLLAAVRRHLELEDEILLPTLRSIDAWGPERAKRLAAEHESQRRSLAAAETELARVREPRALVEVMERYAEDLEQDMAAEERTELDEELLREFPIRTDFGGA